MHEDKEREWILNATEILKQHAGVTPKGWLGPWISESHVTPDLLQVHPLPATASSIYNSCFQDSSQEKTDSAYENSENAEFE